jgi:hypothetical protein
MTAEHHTNGRSELVLLGENEVDHNGSIKYVEEYYEGLHPKIGQIVLPKQG